MARVFLILISLLLLLAPQAHALTCNANWYIDMSLAAGADDGTSPGDAWNNLADAGKGLNSAGFANGDCVWIRRATGGETQGAECDIGDQGIVTAPLRFIGWPRDAFSITSATWVNGSTTVDDILPASMDREQHVGRFITAPDGFNYLITKITDANTIIIDREYAGAGVTLENGAATISADEYFDDRPAAARAGWDGDADDLPAIDFNDGNFRLDMNGKDYIEFAYLHIMDSSSASGILYGSGCWGNKVLGSLFSQAASNAPMVYLNDGIFIERTIFDGSATGTSERLTLGASSSLVLKDSAIYGMGGRGIYAWAGPSNFFLDNVNIGVEEANADDDILAPKSGVIKARDLKLGGTNGTIDLHTDLILFPALIYIENYDKILGAYRHYLPGRLSEKVAVTDENPNKKYSDDIIEITASSALADSPYTLTWVYEHRSVPTASGKDYRVYIYNDTGQTLNDDTWDQDIWMQCDSIVQYDDDTDASGSTEHVIQSWYSDEIDIADAAVGGDDWDYLECSNVTTDTDVLSTGNGFIRCRVFVSRYDAGDTGSIYIDPDLQIGDL